MDRSALPLVSLSENMDRDLYIDPLIVQYVDDDPETEINLDELPIMYLHQDDFTEGTLRIQQSGEYILTQDIVVNFNGPSEDTQKLDDFSPNAYDIDDLHWYPRRDQDEAYPGLYTFHSKFTLGFFAAISIECDNVVINLNGYSLSMEYTFYFQQRFFSLIELGNQPFISGQGPANWGADEIHASNVVIKDGTLGLSSHHSIHGNRNQQIVVQNVRMTQFDVAGFGCNACNNVVVEGCVIGPQNTNIPVLGRYTHARTFLPRIKNLVDKHGDEYMTFSGREPVLVSDLADRMVNEMDMIYNHFVHGTEYDEDDEQWISAKNLFYNPTGWMDGGSSYGLVFSGDGAAVIGIGCRTDGTANITVRDVEIYGIYTAPIEV